MMKKRYLIALGAFSAALVACGSSIEQPPGADDPGVGGTSGNAGSGGTPPGTGGSNPTGAGGSSAGSSGSAGTGATSGGGGTGSGGTAGVPTCIPGIPSTSQIPRMSNKQYDKVVAELVGVTTLANAPNGNPSSLLVEDFDGQITQIAWRSYQTAADSIATAVMAGDRSRFITCDPSTPACLTDTIRTFGRKAFRRPLTDAEVTSFLRLSTDVTPPGTPDEVAEAILFTFLSSPSFLMLPELAQEPEGAAIKLSSHEIATRLSFLLWDSLPDATLNGAADNGLLTTQAQILEQAQRMVMMREKTAPVVAAFHRAYADIRPGSHWGTVDHDTTAFPKYSPAAVTPMMAEIDAFFEEVAFQNGSFRDLLLSNVAYVNRDTAAVYGLDPAGYGTTLTRVELNANERPGFLTRMGFLSSFSAESATSPILRGAFIATKVIGTKVQDPPPEAALTPVPEGNYRTQRQLIEALTSLPKCVGCHATTINPPGFVLEAFDSIGGLQTVDPLGDPVVTSAEVVFTEENIQTIDTPLELMTALAEGQEAKHRYVSQWVTFATGRVDNPADVCTVDVLSTRLSENGYTILELLTDLTQTDAFRLRTVGN
jgi:hypothetical protein